MKIFISWSGEVSGKIANKLYNWLPKFDDRIEPFLSKWITAGKRSQTEIEKELFNSNFGIFCYTKTNLNSSWMLFEAGAISKNINKQFVCPVLFNIEKEDLKKPVNSFHAYKIDIREEMLKLIEAIYMGLYGKEKLNINVKKDIENLFINLWPEFLDFILIYKASDEFVANESEDFHEEISIIKLELEKLKVIEKEYLSNSEIHQKLGRWYIKNKKK